MFHEFLLLFLFSPFPTFFQVVLNDFFKIKIGVNHFHLLYLMSKAKVLL